jgi:hypothetical protein
VAKLNVAAVQNSSVVQNNFRNSILTMISIQRLLCLRSLKFAASGKHIFLAQAHVATPLCRRNKRVFEQDFFTATERRRYRERA